MAAIDPAEKERLIAIYDRLIELYTAQETAAATGFDDAGSLQAEVDRLQSEAREIRRLESGRLA